MSLADEITNHIITQFASEVDPEELHHDFDLLDSGLVDSLGLVRLITWVGNKYDIDMDDIDVAPDDFRSVDAIRAFAEKYGALNSTA